MKKKNEECLFVKKDKEDQTTKFKNALDLIQENIQNFNIRLQTLSVSSLFSQAGLNSSDLLLRGNDTVGMARAFGVLNSLKENNQLSSQTSFNKLYGELKKEDMYGIIGNSNITTNQGIMDLINKIEEAILWKFSSLAEPSMPLTK